MATSLNKVGVWAPDFWVGQVQISLLSESYYI